MRDAAQRRLAVGFFDGVHLGHRAILDGADAVLTFRNHPLSVLDPPRAPRLIMPPASRLEALRALGVREVTMLEFTRELAGTDPEEFVRRHLSGAAGPGGLKVLCGANWRFGRDGAGDAELLRRLGIDVEVRPYAEWRGERISSSRIRAALLRGEVEDAAEMLGRPYAVGGRTVRGKGLGRRLGFPTVNIVPDSDVLLPHGVYAVRFCGLRGVANFGLAPTLREQAWREPVLEVHALDGEPEADLPSLRVEILRRIRPERTFADMDELRAQLARDCQWAIGCPA